MNGKLGNTQGILGGGSSLPGRLDWEMANCNREWQNSTGNDKIQLGNGKIKLGNGKIRLSNGKILLGMAKFFWGMAKLN